LRPFSKWAGQQIEQVCDRNDRPRPGRQPKPAWEAEAKITLLNKIHEEMREVDDAYMIWYADPADEKNMRDLQGELADLAAVVLMLSASIDPIMSGLRHGKIRGRSWNEQEKA